VNSTRRRVVKVKRQYPELWTFVILAFTSIFALFLAQDFFVASGETQTSSSSGNIILILFFITMTLVFTGVILFLAKRKGVRAVRILFIVLSIYVIFWISIPISDLIVSVQPISYAAAVDEFYVLWIAIPAILGYMLIFRNEWYITDIVGFMLSAGLAAAWGSLINVWYTIVLLAAFAVYDYISVYKTKHMVSLAKTAFATDIPMLFVIPSSPGFSMKDIAFDDEGRKGDMGALMLGFGDIAMPCILIISSTISFGFRFPFFILPLIGAAAGLLVLFLTAKRPAPGLPYINTGVIGGFLLAFALFR
jgi:presenilin-like A22 family membrane protease